MMEGRWTIHARGWGHLVAPTDPKNVAPGSWPVVPCDDAAIERGATAIDALFSTRPGASAIEISTTILRAAGETP